MHKSLSVNSWYHKSLPVWRWEYHPLKRPTDFLHNTAPHVSSLSLLQAKAPRIPSPQTADQCHDSSVTCRSEGRAPPPGDRKERRAATSRRERRHHGTEGKLKPLLTTCDRGQRGKYKPIQMSLHGRIWYWEKGEKSKYRNHKLRIYIGKSTFVKFTIWMMKKKGNQNTNWKRVE